MQIYEEFVRRGLIAQVTDEQEIHDLINNGKARFYIGFDCTADSLTAGHFMALTLMKRLQMAGNQPVALIGGGTTMIGDPSGRTDMRKMLTKADIDHNAECFRRQMERFIEFGEDKAIMVNNADWLLDLNYIELLREVGTYFSVNNMLRAECYKQRMEKGLSFFEFNYMIMQSYDFYHLFKEYGCNMQFGGDDQWSNMLGGTELIRKKLGKDAYAMTKMVHGEDEAGAAQKKARAIFGGGSTEHVPEAVISESDLVDGKADIMSLLVLSGLCASRSDARRNIQQDGVLCGEEKVTDIAKAFDGEELRKGVVLRRGKKNFKRVILK